MPDIESKEESRYKYSIRVTTDKPFERFKEDSTKELEGSWYSFSIRYEWLEQTCSVKTRIGMSATLTYDEGLITSNIYSDTLVPDFLRKLVHRDIERSTARVALFSDVAENEKKDLLNFEWVDKC